jgi:hypothetical protein
MTFLFISTLLSPDNAEKSVSFFCNILYDERRHDNASAVQS